MAEEIGPVIGHLRIGKGTDVPVQKAAVRLIPVTRQKIVVVVIGNCPAGIPAPADKHPGRNGCTVCFQAAGVSDQYGFGRAFDFGCLHRKAVPDQPVIIPLPVNADSGTGGIVQN